MDNGKWIIDNECSSLSIIHYQFLILNYLAFVEDGANALINLWTA